MTNRTRAFRRHQRERAIKKALRSYIMWWYDPILSSCSKREYAVRMHKNRAKCSCYMCGNQRHNDWQSLTERLTMQERKDYNLLFEGLDDYYVNTTNTNDTPRLV